jgi:hypothetical protein
MSLASSQKCFYARRGTECAYFPPSVQSRKGKAAAAQSVVGSVEMRSKWRCRRRSRELVLGSAVAAVGDGALLTTCNRGRLDATRLVRDGGDDSDAEAFADKDLRVPGSLRRTLVAGRLVDDGDDGDGDGDDDFFFSFFGAPDPAATTATFGLLVLEPGEMSISGPSSSSASVHEPWWLAVGEDGDALTLDAGATRRSVGADRAVPPARRDGANNFSRTDSHSKVRLDEAIVLECVELRPLDTLGSPRARFTFELGFDSVSTGGSVVDDFVLSFADLLGGHVDRSLHCTSFLSVDFSASAVKVGRLRRDCRLVTE